MKTIVTGGAGFIGSNFLGMVVTENPEKQFVCLDSLTYAGNRDNLADIEDRGNFTFVCCDVCERSVVQSLVREGDVVIHFAAESHVDNSIEGADEFVRTNVYGTHVLLDVARKAGVSRFVQVSTDEVYGSLGFSAASSREVDILDPSSPYSASKAAAEMLCLAAWHTFKFPVSITRSSNNYGPFQFPEKVIPLFVTNLIDGVKVPLYGEGLNVRDWIYVLDNCRAIDLVARRGEPGEVYNIGAGNEIANIDLTRMILEAFGRDESWIERVSDRKGHDLRYSLDCSKIRALGWTPEISQDFAAALRETVDWYRNHEEWWRKLKK